MVLAILEYVVILRQPAIVCFLLFSSCTHLNQPRTLQQKGLEPSAFETLSSPIYDMDIDFTAGESPEAVEAVDDDSDNESSIDEKFRKRISITASEKMCMRDILTQMAELSGVNIFIAQDIEGGVSFTAKNRPFLDILKDICSSSGLKYTITGNSVKIEHDSPMLKFYRISALNMQRDIQSSVSISTDIFNSTAVATNSEPSQPAGGDHSSSNGSSSVILGSVKNDFWTEVETSLKTIIGDSNGNYASVHRQGGLITAYTTQSKHTEIQRYIKLLKEASEAQVLIEARIIEVNLLDEFKSGINWDITRIGGRIVNLESKGLFTAELHQNSDKSDNRNWNLIATFVEKFGAVKTLSSPRITILNNNSAVLKVAKNEVIYLPSFQKQHSGRNSDNITDTLSTNLKSIPIGLIMTVHPSIDVKNDTILLTLRPTISRIVGYTEVPFLFNNYSQSKEAARSEKIIQKIPTVDVREMDSVLKLKSGQTVVMGGLMSDESNNNRRGLPGFHNSLIDIATSNRDRGTKVTELVIFLRATILKNKKNDVYHKADERIYNRFSSDPRRLRLKK